MAKAKSPEVISVIEVLVHVPPRGKRVALITLATETGPVTTKYEVSEDLIHQIVSHLRHEARVIE